jgi:hypothetical protein
MDFKIPDISTLSMTITQKIDGVNANIYIKNGHLEDASSSLNFFGFEEYIDRNKSEIISKLGDGSHYGEWCGPGINSGEGLAEKKLVLFNFRRWVGKPLPSQMGVVPLIYEGPVSLKKINEIMDELKRNGSYLVTGFMNPEGIVIEIGKNFYKKEFGIDQHIGEKFVNDFMRCVA